jgi:hypothetical protein
VAQVLRWTSHGIVAGNRFAATLTEGCHGQDSDQEKARKTPRSF